MTREEEYGRMVEKLMVLCDDLHDPVEAERLAEIIGVGNESCTICGRAVFRPVTEYGYEGMCKQCARAFPAFGRKEPGL